MASLKTTVTVYNWLFKLIGAALLLGLAGLLFFLDETSLFVEAFVGILIGVYALIRVVPFIKTQESDLIKSLHLIESLVGVSVAVILIGFGLFGEGVGNLFQFLFGGVLIMRGMVHFYSVGTDKEQGDHPSYFFHIGTLIIGTLVIVQGFSARDLAILIALLALGASLYLGVDAYNGYTHFRRRKTMPRARKDDNVIDDESIDVPKDEEIEEERIIS